MIYLLLSVIFGIISVIGFVFPTASDESAPAHTESTAVNMQTSAGEAAPIGSIATPSTMPLSSVTISITSVPSISVVTQVPIPTVSFTFTNQRLRFSFVYDSNSEAVVECPTLGETVDRTQYLITAVSQKIGCSQITGVSDLSVERKADFDGTVILPTYSTKKAQLVQQNPTMTIESESDISIGGKPGKRWKTSAFDLLFVEFDGVLFVLTPEMAEIHRQFQFGP